MARKTKKRRTRGGSACNGTAFKMKTKRGPRCACAKTDAQGRFSAHFIRSSACPRNAKTMTYKQAQKEYS